MQTLSRKTTLRAKHVTHTSGEKDMITAGEGVQIKTLGFVEVFVSNVGPGGVVFSEFTLQGWFTYFIHDKAPDCCFRGIPLLLPHRR